MILPGKGWGQTTVFSDDFSTNTSATWTTSGAIGARRWYVNRPFPDNKWGGRRNTLPAQLELTNDVGGNTNSAGWVYAYTSTSGFSSPYNTTLSSNTGIVTWTFNMRTIRTNPAGFENGNYGVAYILGGTSISPAITGNGYAVVLGGFLASDPVRLVEYTSGLQSLGSGQTGIIVSSTSGLDDFGDDYISVKVTYTPATNSWEFYLRNDGSSGFIDPTSGTLTSQGTAVNTTYTSTALDYMGGYLARCYCGKPNSLF